MEWQLCLQVFVAVFTGFTSAVAGSNTHCALCSASHGRRHVRTLTGRNRVQRQASDDCFHTSLAALHDRMTATPRVVSPDVGVVPFLVD